MTCEGKHVCYCRLSLLLISIILPCSPFWVYEFYSSFRTLAVINFALFLVCWFFSFPLRPCFLLFWFHFSMIFTTQRAVESAPRWKYDVFLSFRGVDTRKGFISHLYHELQYWQAIKTFKDDRELEIGASISPELLTAIKGSHLVIVVLSPNYASSTWCLDELAEIIESRETRANTILPIFFNVEPSDVRNQRRTFAEAFANHEKSIDDMKKVQRWRAALRKVANLSGWNLKSYQSEREVIKDIVIRVWSEVRPLISLSDSTDKLVGVDYGLTVMSGLLALEVNDVRFIGVWGMGGVGKTTLAKLVFQRLSHHFEITKFLFNVREVSAKHGTLVDLQKQLVSPISKENTQIWDEQQGTDFIRKYLFNKKILLIIDDVDHYNQLEILVGNKSWFGDGSRIIVTSRDERLLIEHDIELSFKVEGLNDHKALELFSQNAFKEDQPKDEFLELSKCFVDYAKGLPLALKILGRSLYKRDLNAWNSALDKLKTIPIPTIFDSLKLSFDELDDMQKNIFLDVAHFYKGMERGQVIKIFESCGLCGWIGIDILIEKSLITIESFDNVEMHDLVQEMAREIVRQECIEDPGLRSRLCNQNDIFRVFKTNTGTKAIRGIRLCLPSLEESGLNWNRGFSKISELMFLEFDNLMIKSGPQYLPSTLRTLKWSLYPSRVLPASFRPNLLVELKMEDSKLVQLWDGKQDFPNLKRMNLWGSYNLTKTPDFTGVPNLEILGLGGCRNLVEVHPSITVHKKLILLNLLGCESIKNFPTEIEMEYLEDFYYGNCSKVRIPDFARGMRNLLSLDLDGTVLEKRTSSMKFSFWNLLTKKSLEPLVSCLSSLRELRFLSTLSLNECKLGEGELPDDIGYCMPYLEVLYLTGNNFVTLPASIKCLSELQLIDMSRCRRLQQMPDLPPSPRLVVRLDDCASLKMLSRQSPVVNTVNVLKVWDYCFYLTSVNSFGLIDDEGWNDGTFSMLKHFASQLPWLPKILLKIDVFTIISPGSKISAWLNIQGEGDTLYVELPSDRESCRSKWTGIMLCVVFSNHKTTPAEVDEFVVRCSSRGIVSHPFRAKLASHFTGDHIWVFYLPREQMQRGITNISFLFKAYYSTWSLEGIPKTPCPDSVKRCAARLLCEEDLKELDNATMKISKWSRKYCDDEEAEELPSSSGSGSGKDGPSKEPLFKRLKA
ncbi:TMV resistance protein N-like [Argentina anserina]|uniref:TMV resistance protein N-like n=1 Tax=Argentina anserina TaxID=57926 RepID=UPI00217665FC|nr:TMV resistance protein N-like [Potentilla anserina]